MEVYTPLSFTKKDSNNNNSVVAIDEFIKEAFLILNDACNALLDPLPDEEHGIVQIAQEEDDDDSVTWQLNLTPHIMTLDTSITTVSGLQQVLELIRTNVNPRPRKFHDFRKRLTMAQHDTFLFHQLIYPVLQLSTIPRSIPLGQYNAVQMMRHFVQSFVDCGYSFFVDMPSLFANTEMILSQPGAAAKEHTVETLLVLSICALMCRHTATHHRNDMHMADSLGYTYYSQARQLLEDVFDVHHISVVQSLFILSLYPEDHTHLFSPSRTNNPLLTMAVRMALAMDLHQLDTHHHNESDQKEKLRRFAWMILCADYFAGWHSLGNTGQIDIVSWHVNFPQVLPNETSQNQVEFFSQYCRIVVLRKLDVIGCAYLVALESPTELVETFFNTPEQFKINCDQPTWNTSDVFSLLLHEMYCHSQIFAQLPFLPSYYVESFVKEEHAFQFTDINYLYQSLSKQTIPYTQLLSGTVKSYELDKHREYECIVRLLTTLNKYTVVLEALSSIDTIGCYHSPVYGAILTIHLYLIIQKSNPHPQIQSVCQINLLRTQRILRQAGSIYADAAILFLDKMLTRYHIIPKQEVYFCTLHTKTQEILNALQNYHSLNVNNNNNNSYT